jgi:hypothetical protein
MLTIKSTNNILFTIDINNCYTILDIKNKITQYDVKDMRLIFNGFILEDEKTLDYYNITNDSFIILYIIAKQKDTKNDEFKENIADTENKNNIIINSMNTAFQSVGYNTSDVKNSMATTNNNLLLTLSELEKKDNKNIDTLVSFGFSKNSAKQAYYAFERNLDNAANFLFNSM